MNRAPACRPAAVPRCRRAGGVALLAVLWVLAGAGTAVAVGLAVVRDGIATSAYRSERVRGRWEAEGCLALFRAQLERALQDGGLANSDPWIAPQSHRPERCAITLAPPADGPVDVNAAPDSILRALPGFDADVVGAVLHFRSRGERFRDLDHLIGELPADLKDRVASHYAELVGRAAFVPPAWVVTAAGLIGGRTVPIESERWVRAGDRVAVIRRELW